MIKFLADKPVDAPDGLKWNLFFTPDIPQLEADELKFDGNTLTIPDGRVIDGKPVSFPADGRLALDAILTKPYKPLARAVLVGEFESSEACDMAIGIGMDWTVVLQINGEVLCDTRKVGNGECPVSFYDHVCDFRAVKGRNRIVMIVSGGSRYFTAVMSFFEPRTLKLTHQPWVQFPADNSVEIAFESNYPCAAGVDFRKAGSCEWHRSYCNYGGQIRRDSAIHRVTLRNLDYDCEYEYRAVLIDERRQCVEFAASETGRFFSAPSPDKGFSFAAAADWQFAFGARHQVFDKFFAIDRVRKSNFFAFLGDVLWASDFEDEYLNNFVDPYVKNTDGMKPLVMVRGNHEIYGMESYRFFEYFSAPGTLQGYFAFKYGKVFFMVLDFGDDDGRSAYPSTRKFHDIDPYLDEEREWLRDVVASKACQDAEYRIVLAHAIPQGDAKRYLPGKIRGVIDEFFAGDDPLCRIHLWLGGHVHYALRTIPLANQIRSALPREAVYADNYEAVGERYAFPIMATAGPRKNSPENLQYSAFDVQVTADGLKVDSFDTEGTVFDSIMIASDGTVTELGAADFFKLYDY